MYSAYRIYIRTKKQIQSKITYFLKNPRFDMYWMFNMLSFFWATIFSLIAYWCTLNISFFLVGIFGSVFVIFAINSFMHYTLNDYVILQDIT